MSIRSEQAVALFSSGFSCSQSVLAVFCETYGMQRELAYKIAAGFGGGMKRAEICGAVSGAVMVIGLKYGNHETDKEAKQLCATKTEEFLHAFQQRDTHLSCRALLGCDITTAEGKQHAISEKLFVTRCVDLVVSAVTLLEEAGY